MPDIVYPIGNSLYLNLTNRCTNECGFCIRNLADKFNARHELWLDREPSADELLAAIGDPNEYKEIVFCGYGEPTIRLDVLKQVAAELKSENRNPKSERNPKSQPTSKPTNQPTIRLDTNGHGNLFWGRNILPELKGLIDKVSVSLDAENEEKYNSLCRPHFGPGSYQAVLGFIREAKEYIPEVEASVVDLPTIDKAACRKIAKELGVSFRVRSYYQEKYVR